MQNETKDHKLFWLNLITVLEVSIGIDGKDEMFFRIGSIHFSSSE
jgi:hypothetical protein